METCVLDLLIGFISLEWTNRRWSTQVTVQVLSLNPRKVLNLSVPAIFVLNLTLTRNTVGYLI